MLLSSHVLQSAKCSSKSTLKRQPHKVPLLACKTRLQAEKCIGACRHAEVASASVSLDFKTLRPQFSLYNTMTRSKEVFSTRLESPDQVQMYVCGVTVYDLSHIGHARVYVAFDVLYRLMMVGLAYDVQYVRNITDVDDKIITRAAARGQDPAALATAFIREFHQDMDALGCLPPTTEPRATHHIPDMITLIQRIIANGHAYLVEGGDVFFDVASLPGYGALSGRGQEDNRAGERVPVGAHKRGVADFALWKSAKPGEPSWPSPWGPGRPGWHIECSAMIGKVLGHVIDIHGGGQDLVFPHHENELAQARAAWGHEDVPDIKHSSHVGHVSGGEESSSSIRNAAGCGCSGGSGAQAMVREAAGSSGGTGGAPCTSDGGQPHGSPPPQFVRYWVHNGFVNVDNAKMSKSVGNFFTIREVLARYHPMALRWFLITTHYRAPVSFSTQALDEASARLFYVYQTLLDAHDALAAAGAAGQHAVSEAAKALAERTGQGHAILLSSLTCLLDDLNTPAALSELSAPLKLINDLTSTKTGKKRAHRLVELANALQGISWVLGLLGLLPPQPLRIPQDASSSPPPSTSSTSSTSSSTAAAAAATTSTAPDSAQALHSALAQLRCLSLVRAGLTEEYVAAKIQARAAARAAKDYGAADAIRAELAAVGVTIMDTPHGTTWRPVAPGNA